MNSRILPFGCLAAIAPAILFFGKPALAVYPPGVLEQKKVQTASLRCEARLSVKPPVARAGESVTIRCEIECDGTRELYNPFLSERFKLPAQIVIVSVDGKVRRDLLRPPEPNQQKSDDRIWVGTSGGGTRGRELEVRITKPGDNGEKSGRSTRPISLAPGEYYVQAIYNHWLTATWPNRPSRSGERSWDGDEPRAPPPRRLEEMDNAYVVSDAVKFVVLEGVSQAAENQERPGSYALRLEAHPERPKAVAGSQIKVEIRMTNRSSDAVDVFNPTLNPFLRMRQAVSLEISDSGGNAIGDLLTPGRGSTQDPIRQDWFLLSPGGTVSIERTFRLGSVPGTRFRMGNWLPPGKYYLQLNGRPPLISGLPEPINDRDFNSSAASWGRGLSTEWVRSFQDPAICHSRRVELEILPRTGD
jgi:hypothetical protein